MWKKLFGDFFADAPLFFKLWFGLCLSIALVGLIAMIVAISALVLDDKPLSYRVGESVGEIGQGFEDGFNSK